MDTGILNNRDFTSEFIFSASRSSGAGGQNVNKVNTRVELRFSIDNSMLLSIEEKELIKAKLKTKINLNNELLIVCQTERTQLRNKNKAIELFYQLITKTLTPRKSRKATKPTLQSKTQRLDSKRIHSEKKSGRKKIDL